MYYRHLLFFLTALLMWSIPAAAADTPQVVVSVEPQRYFVKRIAGDLVEVSVMVRPGASPATYEPSPRQLVELADAAAYFAIGVPFESAWLPRIRSTNPAMPIIHTDETITKMAMAIHDHHEEEAHGNDHHYDEVHGHDHHEQAHQEHTEAHHGPSILDPHVWTSPALAKILARNTTAGLAAIAPQHAAEFDTNLHAFLKEIDALDANIRQTLASVPADKRTFLVFHPSWGYFARDYGLNQVPIEAEGKEPGPKALMRIIREGRERRVDVIFVQPQFSHKSAQVIASELDATVVPLDPLAPEWAENLRHAAAVFKEALR